jgi:pimeloyl-ACP methyl ester carboxylesterase
MKNFMFIACIPAFIALIFTACEKDPATPNTGDTRTEQTDVGGYSLYNRNLGSKSPAVVLLTGLGGSTADWSYMEGELGKVATLLNYDREGIGKSTWQKRPKDSKTISRELHTLIAAKKIKPPYILMAHSVAGIHARVFAELYPSEVAGLVLVDPTPEDLIDSLLIQIPADQRDGVREQIRREEAAALQQLPEGGIKEEFKALASCYDQVRAAIQKIGVPVAVISSMKVDANDSPESKAMAKRLRDLMLQRMSVVKKRHYTTEKAGHFVQKDQPELVMEAILWTLSQI